MIQQGRFGISSLWGEDFIMISMTTYWQHFQESLVHLQSTHNDDDFADLMATANQLINIGLRIETLGITEIKGVSDQLGEKAKQFNNTVVYTEEKTYTFNLPKITNPASLVFAILYYQHLSNYQHVSYQGSISWFRQKVVDSVNQKKITTAIQAKAMLQEIRQYFQAQKMTVDEAVLLKSNEEPIKNYVLRILDICKIGKTPAKKETTEQIEPITPAQTTPLETSLITLKQKMAELNTLTETVKQRLTKYTLSRVVYTKLLNDWNRKWLITRGVYVLLSLMMNVKTVQRLNQAEAQLVLAEKELNQYLPKVTAESYLQDLKQQQDELLLTEQKIQAEIAEKTTVQEQKPLQPVQLPAPETPKAPSANQSEYFAFFKKHMPSRYTLQAIAVAGAAITVQTLIS